jgi:hypothetical protein
MYNFICEGDLNGWSCQGANPSLPLILHMGFQLHWGGAIHIPSNCNTGLSSFYCLQSPKLIPWRFIGLQTTTTLMEQGASFERLIFIASYLTWLLL